MPTSQLPRQIGPRPSRRGRISYAPVPFEAPWYRPLLQPLVFATNVALTAWIYLCWRTARVRWSPSLEVLARRTEGGGRPIIYYSWHAYEPLMLLVFRDVPEQFVATVIGHDGLLSRMLQLTGAWFGYDLWIYRRKSPIRPTEQIIDMLRARRCNIGLFPDSGGPYGRVKPGLAKIARATDAVLVPRLVRGRRILMLKWPWRFGFPLPFCSLVVHHGAPLDGRAASTAECQQALEELEERAAQ